jgi:hypothetical protein
MKVVLFGGDADLIYNWGYLGCSLNLFNDTYSQIEELLLNPILKTLICVETTRYILNRYSYGSF